ncbi:recombinase family protein [Colidextribacter sp. OB.20]|nr:recombinase family protein [Colidextribacter sp. OB.20]NBI09708.1 recombinase family protein [Colidextribacter sp. OB.20]
MAPRRAALYIRVSTEEQARKGYSLPAQKEDLEEYAHKNGYAIAGYYIDEGKSARKKYTKRKEFMRMLEDVKAGKIDVILFIKLDRWFRSVADYYKIQEILDAHNVAWKTTQEHYDTETTNGRLYINIRLSVAQDESDRDSDRIKFVFDSKVARGEVISGSLPMGLMIQDKHVVPDPETADIVREFFRHYKEHGTINGAMTYIRETYGIILWDPSARKMLHNPLYKGMYRDNPNYCEPLIPPEEFDAIQKLLERRSIRQNESGRVYIFAGLLKCQECGQKMTGSHSTDKKCERKFYRCRNATIYHRCTHRRQMGENKLEKWLLLNLPLELDRWETEWNIATSKVKHPKVDRAAIQRKMDRLKDLYVNELITMEQYREDWAKYSAQLQEAQETEPTPPPDFRSLRELLQYELPNIYPTLTPEQHRDLWRSVIQEICLDGDNIPRVIFRE